MCVLPRGAEEGEERRSPTAPLPARRPAVRFALFSNTAESTHRPGQLVTLDAGYQALPDLVAVVDASGSDSEELTVELHVQLTEVGTLELSLVSTQDSSRRYRLEFQLRGDARSATSESGARINQLHPRFREATELLQLFYGKAQKALEGRKINTLRADLEKILGSRERWDTALLRELFTTLLASVKRRRRSADHERLWLQLTGYCMRPGYGYPVDAWRVEQIWSAYEESVQFSNDAAVWAQFWILWRRIAGGLDDAQQARIFEDLAFYLDPNPRRRPRPKGARPLALEEMVRLAGCLERIAPTSKVELGEWLFTRVANRDISQASAYFALGRIGARAPLYGSAHAVVPAEVASRWSIGYSRSIYAAPITPPSRSRSSRASPTTASATCRRATASAQPACSALCPAAISGPRSSAKAASSAPSKRPQCSASRSRQAYACSNEAVRSVPLRRSFAGVRTAEHVREARDDRDQLGRIDRLGHVGLKAGAQRSCAVLGPGERGQRDGWQHRFAASTQPHALDQAVAVFVGQADVAHDHVGSFALERIDGSLRRGHRDDAAARLRQHALDQLAGVGVVFHDQQLEACEHIVALERVAEAGLHGRLARRGAREVERQLDHERRALALTRAMGGDRSTMHLHQLFDDREAQTQPPVAPGRRCVGLWRSGKRRAVEGRAIPTPYR